MPTRAAGSLRSRAPCLFGGNERAAVQEHPGRSVEPFTLSSDAGEPLFPDSVEAMRLVRGYMEAFGLNQEELYTVCTKNPAKVVGLELN